ncbi:MAG: sulfite exporter TauE/SafE family protein [Flavobacteriaceae bacterium]
MLFSSVILGLVSSLHCVGMCGPIALMLPIDRQNKTKKAFQIALYHLGRILSYGFLGLIFGLLGRSLYLAGIQQQLSIVIGIFIISVAVIPERIFARYNFSKPIYRAISYVKTSLGKQFKNRSNKSIFTIGILNGFLPCGMVYVALFGALAMQNALYGMFFMMLYGLGTVPLMSLVVYFSSHIKNSLGKNLTKLIPIVTTCVGVLFILRGLGLDIPFVSPSNLQLFVGGAADCD